MDRTPLKFTGASAAKRKPLRVAAIRTSTPWEPPISSPGGRSGKAPVFSPATPKLRADSWQASPFEKSFSDRTFSPRGETSFLRPIKSGAADRQAKPEAKTSSTGNRVQQISDLLFDDFHHATGQLVSVSSCMMLLDTYIQKCDAVFRKLQELNARVVLPEAEANYLRQMETCLGKERWIWGLLRYLHAVRTDHSCIRRCPREFDVDEDSWRAVEKCIVRGLSDDRYYVSEKMVVCGQFAKDKKIRKLRIIIEWLEEWRRLTSSLGATSMAYFNRGADGSSSEGKTRLSQDSRLDDSFRSTATSSSTKQHGRESRDLDEVRKLTSALAHFMRTGERDEFQKLCFIVGEQWRMSLWVGNDYYHDPNYYKQDSDVKLLAVGNSNRVQWKSTAFSMAEDSAASKEDRQLYAIASCNLSAMLGFAESWEDALWAYMRCLVDQTLERAIHETCGLPESALPPSYWKKDFSLETVFAELESSPKPQIRRQARSPMMKLIKAVVLDEAQHFGSLSSDAWDDEESVAYGQHLNRFMIHVSLFYRLISKPLFPQNVVEEIIASYVQFLMPLKKVDHVFFYLVSLSDDAKAVQLLSEFFKLFEDEDIAMKSNLIAQAEDYGLDPRAAAMKIVEESRRALRTDGRLDVMLSRSPTMNATDRSRLFTGLQVTEEDKRNIATLDWVLVDGCDHLETLVQVNALARCFLLRRNLKAARLALKKLPSREFDLLSPRSYKNASLDHTSAVYREDEQCMREYDGLTVLTVAFEEYEKWMSHSSQTKRSEDELSRLKASAVRALQRVIDFPHGWLQDRGEEVASCFDAYQNDVEEDASLGDRPFGDQNTRRKELFTLRSIFLPVVVQTLTEIHSRELPRVGQVDGSCARENGADENAAGDVLKLEKTEKSKVRSNARAMTDPAVAEKVANARGLLAGVSALAGSYKFVEHHLSESQLTTFCAAIAQNATDLCNNGFDGLGYAKDDSDGEEFEYDGDDSVDLDFENELLSVGDSENEATEYSNADGVDDDDVEMAS